MIDEVAHLPCQCLPNQEARKVCKFNDNKVKLIATIYAHNRAFGSDLMKNIGLLEPFESSLPLFNLSTYPVFACTVVG